MGNLSGIMPYIGQGLDAFSNLASTSMSNTQQKNLSAQEMRYNEYMWNKQNEYNAPAAQMARFKAAGLNPNLIYGQGTPGNATTRPEFARPNLTVPRLKLNTMDYMSQFQDIGIKNQQLAVMASQQSKIDEETRSRRIDNDAKEKYAGDMYWYNLGTAFQKWRKTEWESLEVKRSLDFNRIMQEARGNFELQKFSNDIKLMQVRNALLNWEMNYKNYLGPKWQKIIDLTTGGIKSFGGLIK